jgi:hypothetical protein
VGGTSFFAGVHMYSTLPVARVVESEQLQGGNELDFARVNEVRAGTLRLGLG